MAIKQTGKSVRFDYTGNVQEFTAPVNGLYRLEVWGAGGGAADSATGGVAGGLGGYSEKYKYLNKGDTIYIAVGGKGLLTPDPESYYDENDDRVVINGHAPGGYNGGGSAYSFISDDGNGWVHTEGSGGGATHIAATDRGELKNYENYKSEVLLVAGGGGGGLVSLDAWGYLAGGGNGGGLTSGIPSYYCDPPDEEDEQPGSHMCSESYQTTQTYGWKFGQGENDKPSGGGGGWMGGRIRDHAAWGGSGYIGNDTETVYKGKTYKASSITGCNSGNGAAVITLVQGSLPSIYLGNKEISTVYFGNKEISDIKIS